MKWGVVSVINCLGGAVKGFGGPEIFRCRKTSVTGADGQVVDLGFVGEVMEVNTRALLKCIENGVTPVISPTARGEDGRIYNCNADVAAAQVAIALKAKRLVFMSDVPGLLRDPKNPESVISQLKVAEIDGMKRAGVFCKRMIPKADSAVDAIQARVGK